MVLHLKRSHGRTPWGALALGIGIGAAGATLLRQLSGSRDWKRGHVDRLRQAPHGHDDRGAPWAAPATTAPVTHIPIPQHSEATWPDQSLLHTAGPLPELPEDKVLPGHERPQGMDTAELTQDLRPIDDEDIRTFAYEELREHPDATYEEVLAAWRVYRGVTLDSEEEARIAAVYGRLHEAFDAA